MTYILVVSQLVGKSETPSYTFYAAYFRGVSEQLTLIGSLNVFKLPVRTMLTRSSASETSDVQLIRGRMILRTRRALVITQYYPRVSGYWGVLIHHKLHRGASISLHGISHSSQVLSARSQSNFELSTLLVNAVKLEDDNIS